MQDHTCTRYSSQQKCLQEGQQLLSFPELDVRELQNSLFWEQRIGVREMEHCCEFEGEGGVQGLGLRLAEETERSTGLTAKTTPHTPLAGC